MLYDSEYGAGTQAASFSSRNKLMNGTDIESEVVERLSGFIDYLSFDDLLLHRDKTQSFSCGAVNIADM